MGPIAGNSRGQKSEKSGFFKRRVPRPRGLDAQKPCFLSFFELSRVVACYVCVYKLFFILNEFLLLACILLMSHKMVEKRVFFRGLKRGRKRPVFGVFFGSLFSCHCNTSDD